jgi:hypothetical protein
LRVDPNATYSVSYVNVSESNAGGYKVIYANDGTNVDSGLNVNWVFATPGNVITHFERVNLSGVNVNSN